MYTGNGVTTAFPLPEGATGNEVWLIPPGGEAVRMKQGAAYTLENGAARFVIPPPEGWTVSFHEIPKGAAVMSGGCVVVRADGTMEVVNGDPAELLEQARALLGAAKAEREELKALIAARGAEIKALADEAKATLESRLLNYGARAEDAIAAAASAARLDIAEKLSGTLDEIRAGQKGVAAAQIEIRAAQTAILNSAQAAANEAAEQARSQVHDCCREAVEAYERIRALRPELEETAEKARSAASTAGREVAETMTARCEVLLEELRGIRGRLERDVIREAEREQKRRDAAVEEMRRIRDEADREMRVNRTILQTLPQESSEEVSRRVRRRVFRKDMKGE